MNDYSRVKQLFRGMLLVGVLIILPRISASQSLSEAEYFFDTDPGIGNGTEFTYTVSGDTLDQHFDIGTSGLEPGFHKLYIRLRYDDGTWGIQEGKSFFILDPQDLQQPSRIVKLEYFYDNDPGTGNGTSIAITSDTDSLDQTFNMSVAGLEAGFHKLYIRTQDADGIWSQAEGRSIYVLEANFMAASPQLTGGEYFFDEDPGIGQGTEFELTAADSVDESVMIPLSDLEPGFHKLGIRTRDASGVWGISQLRSFYVLEAYALQASSQLVGVEYFLGEDPGAGQGTAMAIEPTDSIDTNLLFDLTGVAEGDYLFSARVQNADGQWSIYQSDSIQISDMAAIADFTYVQDGFTFDFTDASTNAETWKWDFGDGAVDETNQTSISHTYEQKGSHEVCLYISNELFSDSLCQTVVIPNETPTDITLSATSVEENNTVDQVIASLFTVDSDDDAHTYTLVPGEGDADNAAFNITEGNLLASEIFDFETKSTYTVRIQTDDSFESGAFEKSFTIQVTDGNDAPSDIAVSNDLVEENVPSGTTVGELTAVDQDESDTHVFELVAGTGDDQNALFVIEGNVLKTAGELDFEQQAICSLRVMATDNNGGEFVKTLSIDLSDVNEPPTAFSLLTPSANVILGSVTPVMDWENAPDPEGMQVQYELHIGEDKAGLPDEIFVVDQLVESVHELTSALQEDKTYYWKVIASDETGLSTENSEGWQVFSVNAENMNPNAFNLITPTDSSVEVDLTPVFYWEDNGDPDLASSLTYQVYVGQSEGFENTTPVEVNDNNLVWSESLDDNAAWYWKVIASDGEASPGSVESQTFMFWTNTVLEPPLPFDLLAPTDGFVYNEVTQFDFSWQQAQDNDPNDYATYTLVVATDEAFGDVVYNANNSTETSLTISESLTDGNYFWKVVATDTDQLETESIVNQFAIETAQAPIIADQSFNVEENASEGTALGTVTASDPNGDQLAFSIISGNNASGFAIDEGSGEISVVDQSVLDFESNPSFNLVVEVSDGVLSGTATIQIDLINVNESPSIEVEDFSLAENSPNGTLVGTISGTDPENDQLSFTIMEGNISDAFTIDMTGAITVANSDALDFETLSIIDLVIEVSDGEYQVIGNVRISLTDVEEAGVLGASQEKLAIYPNPASTEVFISGLELIEVHIYDLTGREVLYTSQFQIDISNLKSGTYLFKIHTPATVITRSLVIDQK